MSESRTAETTQAAEITRPIYYDDGAVIHECDSGVLDRGVRMVWTKCDIDVPPDEGFTVEGGSIEVTCPACLAASV
jgi:hypothetical protein